MSDASNDNAKNAVSGNGMNIVIIIGGCTTAALVVVIIFCVTAKRKGQSLYYRPSLCFTLNGM